MKPSHRLLFLFLSSLLPLAAQPEHGDGLYAEIDTARGRLLARLFVNEAPLTVANFVGLAEGTLAAHNGEAFFNGTTFHRVVPGFVIQGGDPLGNGEGGPGYEFPDELSPQLSHDTKGILSMANEGPDTNGSQFFITLAPVERLDYLHSVFGRVVEGLDVLDRIQEGDTMTVRIRRMGDAATGYRATPELFARLAAATPRATPRHLEDPESLLPTNPPWARILEHKLGNFERFTGGQLFVLLQSARAPEDADATPEALAERWAKRCQVETDGITALYIADQDEWGLWVGSDLQGAFNPDDRPLSDVVQSFITKARAAAQAAIRERFGNETPPPDQALKRHLDAVIDGLIPVIESYTQR